VSSPRLGLLFIGTLVLLSLSGTAAALGKGTTTVTIPNGASTNTSGPGFTPSTVTVVIGVNESVTWVNNDISPHTVTADGGTFDSGNLAPGQSFTFDFTSPGKYTYHCNYHNWMHGTIIVKSASTVPEFPAGVLALILFGAMAVALFASRRPDRN
jgi:plastocyanin